MLHNGFMCLDPRSGYETFNVRNSPILKVYLLRHLQCELASD